MRPGMRSSDLLAGFHLPDFASLRKTWRVGFIITRAVRVNDFSDFLGPDLSFVNSREWALSCFTFGRSRREEVLARKSATR